MATIKTLNKAISESEKGRKHWKSMLGNKHSFKKAMAKKMREEVENDAKRMTSERD